MTRTGSSLPPVQMLWVEGRLSRLERLAMASFLACGHGVELYTYGLDDDPPAGVVVHEAAAIVPAHLRFRRQVGMAYGSWGPFSDLFRFTLLHERGGIWCDADMVCLKPLEFCRDMPVFFSSELAVDNADGQARHLALANCGAMQLPARHPLMTSCLEIFDSLDHAKAAWAASGPGVVRAALDRAGATDCVLHPDIFCPVPHWETTSLLFGVRTVTPSAYAVHFWNEILRWNFFDKNAHYDKHSLFERLCAHYLPDDKAS